MQRSVGANIPFGIFPRFLSIRIWPICIAQLVYMHRLMGVSVGVSGNGITLALVPYVVGVSKVAAHGRLGESVGVQRVSYPGPDGAPRQGWNSHKPRRSSDLGWAHVRRIALPRECRKEALFTTLREGSHGDRHIGKQSGGCFPRKSSQSVEIPRKRRTAVLGASPGAHRHAAVRRLRLFGPSSHGAGEGGEGPDRAHGSGHRLREGKVDEGR